MVNIEIKPQKFDDKQIDKIELDLDKITGKVMLDSEKEFSLGRNITDTSKQHCFCSYCCFKNFQCRYGLFTVPTCE